ncbi:MAG: hypothetical protein WBJ84_09730 [Bacteroidales bacterium]
MRTRLNAINRLPAPWYRSKKIQEQPSSSSPSHQTPSSMLWTHMVLSLGNIPDQSQCPLTKSPFGDLPLGKTR